MILALTFTSLLPFAALPGIARSATPQVADSADKVVTLRNMTANTNEVSGDIVNNSRDGVRDVNLQVVYSWRWNNEMHPGNNPPGGAFYQTVEREIAPGQSERFSFKPPTPLPMRSDGYYDVSVKVVGYSQVYRGERR
jgi:hypothetical protein